MSSRRSAIDLVRHAVERSPYYRDALGPDAIVDLVDLPTLPKPRLMDELDRVATDRRVRRADLEAFLSAADRGELFLDEYRVFSTSGTSSAPGLFLYSQEEFAHWAAICLRTLVRVGLTPGTRLVGIGAPSPLHLSQQMIAAAPGGSRQRAAAVSTVGARRLPQRDRAPRRGAARGASARRAAHRVRLLDVLQYQVVHRPSRLDVCVVVRRGAGYDVATRVRSALEDAVREAGAPCPVDVSVVDSSHASRGLRRSSSSCAPSSRAA